MPKGGSAWVPKGVIFAGGEGEMESWSVHDALFGAQ